MDSTSFGGTPSRRLSTPSRAIVTSSASRLRSPGASWRGVMLHLHIILHRHRAADGVSRVLKLVAQASAWRIGRVFDLRRSTLWTTSATLSQVIAADWAKAAAKAATAAVPLQSP